MVAWQNQHACIAQKLRLHVFSKPLTPIKLKNASKSKRYDVSYEE